MTRPRQESYHDQANIVPYSRGKWRLMVRNQCREAKRSKY